MKTLLYSFVFLLSCTAHAQVITTVAGCDSVSLGDGGPAINAGLFLPMFVTVDNLGNLYISEREHNRIRKVNTSGIITTIAGGGGAITGFGGDNGPATVATLDGPGGIKFDTKGNLYIADGFNGCIRKVDTAGIITTIAGMGTTHGYTGNNGLATLATLGFPHDIAIDQIGNVLIADFGNNVIRKVDTAGIISTIAGTGVAGFSGDGGPATAAHIYEPYGIVTDAGGNIFFTEYGNSRVRKINTSGIITTIAGTIYPGYNGDSTQATDAKLYQPMGIALDVYGNIYIGDAENSRIRKVNTANIITTIAGNGLQGFSGDGGLAINAELNIPCGVAVDASGNIYIADAYNNRIRQVASTVSVPKISEQNMFKIYPNPSASDFTVDISSSMNEQLTIIITDMMGHKVQELNAMTNAPFAMHIDVPPGMYILYAKTGNGVLMEKIVKTP